MGDIFNRVLVRDYLCSECHSGLIEVYLDGDYRVVCSHDRSDQGRVRKSTVEMLRSRSTVEGVEVRMAYPELEPVSGLSVDRAMEELYGVRSNSPQRPARRIACPSKV